MKIVLSSCLFGLFRAFNCRELSCDQVSLLYVKIGWRTGSNIFKVIFVSKSTF